MSIVRAGAFYQDLVTEVIDAEPDIVTGLEAMFAGAAATLEATDYADACPIETIAVWRWRRPTRCCGRRPRMCSRRGSTPRPNGWSPAA